MFEYHTHYVMDASPYPKSVEECCNKHAEQGWRLHSLAVTERGTLLVFERPRADALATGGQSEYYHGPG